MERRGVYLRADDVARLAVGVAVLHDVLGDLGGLAAAGLACGVQTVGRCQLLSASALRVQGIWCRCLLANVCTPHRTQSLKYVADLTAAPFPVAIYSSTGC